MEPSENLGIFSGLLTFGALMGVGAGALGVTRNHRPDLRFQLKLFAWSYALRFAMSLVIYAGGLLNVLKDEDGSGWMVGVAFNSAWVQEGFGVADIPRLFLGSYQSHHKGFYYLLGCLYFLVEPARLPAAALNGLFGSLLVVYTYRIGTTLFSPRVARSAGVWLCVFPSMVMWSAQTVKEPVIIFLEALAVYGCINIRHKGFSIRHTVLASGCIVLLLPFRQYASYIIMVAAVAGLLPRFEAGRVSVAPVVSVAVVALLLSYSGFLAGFERQNEMLDLTYISNFRNGVAEGGSGVKMDVDLNTSTGMGLALAVGAVHLLLAPFPWQLASGSSRMLMVAPEMVFWWWLFFTGVVPGVAYLVRKRLIDVLPILVVVLGFGLLYSLMFGNVGLVYRQRAQLLPWLLLFAAVGREQRLLRRAASATPWPAAGPG